MWAYSSLKKNFNSLKEISKKMKKINYMAPEMEVTELQINAALLYVSTGAGDPPIHDELPSGEVPVIID